MRIPVDAAWKAGDFRKPLLPGAVNEFELLAQLRWCEDSRLLLSEGKQPSAVPFLLEGKAKLSMNSVEGRRRILGVAIAGDFLGLAAVVSCFPYEIKATVMFPLRDHMPAPPNLLQFLCTLPGCGALSGTSVEPRVSADLRTVALPRSFIDSIHQTRSTAGLVRRRPPSRAWNPDPTLLYARRNR